MNKKTVVTTLVIISAYAAMEIVQWTLLAVAAKFGISILKRR